VPVTAAPWRSVAEAALACVAGAGSFGSTLVPIVVKYAHVS
jgi:hypothetical protein